MQRGVSVLTRRLSRQHQVNASPRAFFSEAPQSGSSDDYLQKILTARVYDVAIETPLQTAKNLSAITGNRVLLKREDLQPVFSFKIRGAYNKIAHLTATEPTQLNKAGIITCSAGNHAQGVALSASKLGIQNLIVMPEITPLIKIRAVQRLGGNVQLVGKNFDEAATAAKAIAREQGRILIHPYDDPYVIAGQGTIGLEILKQCSASNPLDAIFVCVGGGGLIAGISVYIKRIRPEIKIIGVEAADAASMTEALKANERIVLPTVGLFADGAAVKQAGEEPFRLAKKYVDDMITVSTDEICAAIKDCFNDTRSILEPAGALSIAGMKKYVAQNHIRGQTVVAIASGANMNFDRLRFVAERCEEGEALISVIIPEKPGSFHALYKCVAPRNVTGFSYRYSSPEKAYINMSFHVQSQDEINAVIDEIRSNGMEALDLTTNEMAKVHARYLVGGRSPGLKDEVLYRFEYPETPGALANFLQKLSGRWNVSLWNYRNHGSDIARVLVGMQVPEEDRKDFTKFLDTLGVHYINECENPAYSHFLR